jgi:hypothetical protein
LQLLERLVPKKEAVNDPLHFKKSIAVFEKRGQMTMRYLEEMRCKALKNLVNEEFDDVLGENDKKLGKNQAEIVSDTIQRLFQKELLFEQSLNLLTEDEVDINQLLFCAFERIQSENYCPPANKSILLDGHFEYPDQLQMPTSRWLKDKRVAKEFKLDMNEIQEPEDSQ